MINMKKNLFATILVAAIIGLCMPLSASAASIAGLYNTGAGISVDKTQDAHYTFTKISGAGSSSTVKNGYAAVGSGWPIGPWLADNTTSHWLTPTSSRGQSLDPTLNGVYDWSLKFDLSGFDASTASFAGRFAADNSAQAFLNGHLIGTASGFTNWFSFSAASSLFVAGLNTIEFKVTNLHLTSGNPTGLRVEFTSSDVSAIPVPAAIWLFGPALAALIISLRRNTNAPLAV